LRDAVEHRADALRLRVQGQINGNITNVASRLARRRLA
jgi:hypothetical protein